MLGYSESELLALRLEDIIAPDQESDLKLLERLFAAEISSYQVEKQFLRQDKHCFWGWFNVALMRNSQGEPLYFIAQIANVHDRKQTEVALKQSEIRYRAIVEDQTELISRSLADGTISFVNQAYALYFDKSPEELIGKPYQQFIPEEDLEKVMHLINSMDVNNPVAQIENRVTVKGELRWTRGTTGCCLMSRALHGISISGT
jgi:PAS domain S-box-containing protein